MSRFKIAAALAAVAALGAIPARGQHPVPRVAAGKGAFYAACGFSHRAPDDPIVFPGQAGASHSHDFFGARTTAASTNDTIRRSPVNTCERPDTPWQADRSAYWVPTLYVDNEPVSAQSIGAFYTTGFRTVPGIEPFPDGFRMIVGQAKGGPQQVNEHLVYVFTCDTRLLAAGTATTAPTCDGDSLKLILTFPDCWDGVNDDSSTHQAHVAYSRNGQCPVSHPARLPVLTLVIRYPTPGGRSTRLASGDLSTAHADFMNGWDPDKLASLCRLCLDADRYCGGGDRPVPGHE